DGREGGVRRTAGRWEWVASDRVAGRCQCVRRRPRGDDRAGGRRRRDDDVAGAAATMSDDNTTTGFTHLDEHGAARMVDVSAKDVSVRTATARGRVRVSAEVVRLLRD